jgi:multiple sugar transport system substrate-binding protein
VDVRRYFKADWDVSVDSTISSFNDHPAKLMTMYGGGDAIDVAQSSFPNFISQGLVEPNSVRTEADGNTNIRRM